MSQRQPQVSGSHPLQNSGERFELVSVQTPMVTNYFIAVAFFFYFACDSAFLLVGRAVDLYPEDPAGCVW